MWMFWAGFYFAASAAFAGLTFVGTQKLPGIGVAGAIFTFGVALCHLAVYLRGESHD
jgi:hypothetical protein